eukprot:CAMPEP_0181213058 /NCGR_PEP_ID=MMETSP1096-20121128/24694_1 /TAXON_ID=156174 ORGANISM="Chrysochromulina ericina, Strain CCMP281" /NCGR_SAMPLE_ID=MMETSP1096 /ASSEMBLY_ACC=CAM_ASM_000453 /LENGTH=112 /DNA_ID=CAMNT_0023304655 /DNA_START=497 /DNA_END=835 /DNA_ORIENTATION=-
MTTLLPALAVGTAWPMHPFAGPIRQAKVMPLAMKIPALLKASARRRRQRLILKSCKHVAVVVIVEHDPAHLLQPAAFGGVDMRERSQLSLVIWQAVDSKNDRDGAAQIDCIQ